MALRSDLNGLGLATPLATIREANTQIPYMRTPSFLSIQAALTTHGLIGA